MREYSQDMPQSERPTIAINLASFDKLKKRARVTTDTEFADFIDYDRGQLSRILASKAAPGPKFIAAIIQAFGRRALTDLLVIVPIPTQGSSSGAA